MDIIVKIHYFFFLDNYSSQILKGLRGWKMNNFSWGSLFSHVGHLLSDTCFPFSFFVTLMPLIFSLFIVGIQKSCNGFGRLFDCTALIFVLHANHDLLKSALDVFSLSGCSSLWGLKLCHSASKMIFFVVVVVLVIIISVFTFTFKVITYINDARQGKKCLGAVPTLNSLG